MKDRYLFKAKEKNWKELPEDNRWVVGYLVKYPTGEWKIERECDNPPDGDPMWRRVNIIYEVDPSTICQCTGLKDKNGKLIWENDIVMCHGNKKDLCKVCFGEFKVIDIEDMVAVDIVQGWYYKPFKTDTLSKCEPFCYEMPLTNYYLERMEAEVIGNIFDNPELLEVMKNGL